MELVNQSQPPPSSNNATNQDHSTDEKLDLVGGPFAVIESDPGVFTSLTRRLGVRGIELVEMYDIEPWAVDHLNPRGLIFCFLWRKDTHRPADFQDPAAERVWFANQLSDDACASHAILNVLLNCPEVDIGDELRMFRQDTEQMSPAMKGLAVTNSPLLRRAHNSLARPADIRGALNSIATATLEDAAVKSRSKLKPAVPKRGTKPPPAKRAKTAKSASSSPTKKEKEEEEEEELSDAEEEEAYHFIGYVPAYGKVWELDGLKSGPLEVGELPFPSVVGSEQSQNPQNQPISTSVGWMDVVRPALRMKMEKYGGAAEGGSNIRFSLLAIVDGLYEKASDELQLLKRERVALERKMGVGWEEKVDPALLESNQHAFSAASGDKTYASDFGSRRMEQDIRILDMPEGEVVSAWETCVRNALRANVAVEDELAKAVSGNMDHIKRTFDYEPFINAFIGSLHREGLLTALLDIDEDGKKVRNRGTAGKRGGAPVKGKP